MKLFKISFVGLAALAFVSCASNQRMVPQVDVEAAERQAPVTPAPSGGIDGVNAVQYGLDNRFGAFHGFGRPGGF